jgi:hypothetical protein
MLPTTTCMLAHASCYRPPHACWPTRHATDHHMHAGPRVMLPTTACMLFHVLCYPPTEMAGPGSPPTRNQLCATRTHARESLSSSTPSGCGGGAAPPPPAHPPHTHSCVPNFPREDPKSSRTSRLLNTTRGLMWGSGAYIGELVGVAVGA